MEGGDDRREGEKGREEVRERAPQVRDAGASANATNITEIVEERLAASEIEWMAEREKEKGNELFKSGEYKACVEAYDKSVELAPKAATLANRAAAKLKLKLFDSAIEDCTLALEDDPKYVKVLMRRAVARMELMQYEEAHEDILTALDLAPGNKELEKMRDKVLRKMPQTVTQVRIEEVEDSDSDSSDSESGEAGADEAERMAADGFQATVEEINEDEIGTIVEITEEAEEEKPKPAPEQKEKRTRIEIEICSDTDSSDEEEEDHEAVKPAQEMVAPAPGTEEAMAADQPATTSDGAHPPIEDDEEAEAAKISRADDLKVRGNKAYASGDLSAALELYTESISHSETSAAYSNRAQVHLKKGDFESAISDCTSALRLDGGNIKAVYRRAVGLKAAGRWEEAICDFERVKDKLPNRADIAKEIAALGARIRADKEAEKKAEGAGTGGGMEAASPERVATATKQALPVPNSSTEFETNVRFIRKNPTELARYIYQIPPPKFAMLFKKAFTSEILGSTIEGLLAGLESSSEVAREEAVTYCHNVLASLTQANRFSITSKMLNNKQKVCLGELFTRLSEACTDGKGGEIDLASLKKGYGVK